MKAPKKSIAYTALICQDFPVPFVPDTQVRFRFL